MLYEKSDGHPNTPPPRRNTGLIRGLLIGLATGWIAPFSALAASGADATGASVVVPYLEGGGLSLFWCIPFAGILLSIALLPLLAPRFWHHHFGKISAFWVALLILPMLAVFGWEISLYEVLHSVLLEYIPFIILLFSLFTVAGGIRLHGSLVGTPVVNTVILTFGTAIASLMGTTGAAMLLIRPLLRANENRRYRVHTVVFFIFLVANIGGSLSPLGDPPLFLGFLKGVPFFWPTTEMLLPMLFISVILLAVFFVVDTILLRKEGGIGTEGTTQTASSGEPIKLSLEGSRNLILLGAVIGAVLMSGLWRPDLDMNIFHVHVALQNAVRDMVLVAMALISLHLTGSDARKEGGFSWFPILEVGKLFACIFITIIPPIAILRAGGEGALSGLLALVTDQAGNPVDSAYFWLTGILSSFLDNAPTYLVFFNTAGGDPVALTGPLGSTLLAISLGAVFMGANTYIGNAPNFMVRSIAEENGVPMPSFFGYMAWSVGILMPLFVLVQWIFL